MITAAEQYRALVAKLEAINPSEPVDEADHDSEQEDEAYVACIVQHGRSGRPWYKEQNP